MSLVTESGPEGLPARGPRRFGHGVIGRHARLQAQPPKGVQQSNGRAESICQGFFVATSQQTFSRLSQEKTVSIAIINPQAVAKQLSEGKKIELIDVRTPAEYREVHIGIARNFPLDLLDPSVLMQARNGSATEPLYVICRSGSRAQQACEQFVKAGFPNVVNIEGGTMAWEEAGLPVVRGKKAISLERQVRIAAGLFVLLGAALSFVHPAFIGLSALVGAGLVFAGITDTCGMGMILARMPWNQIPTTPSTATESGTTIGASKAPPSCCE